ncbi:MAG: alpha/beta fold hydrolase [Roseitalea porphyridii]|jgi:pimeloyl-ACP methyl ester carboxylesterase
MNTMLTTILIVLAVTLAALGFWLWTPDLPRDRLEARYFAPDGAYVDVDGVRLHVRDTGPRGAPAIIMLHRLGSSLHTWQGWAEALDDRYRVVRFDLPAHGLTGADPAGDYSIGRWVALLDGLMDTLGLESAALIGNSMGGRLAWTMAAKRPARVSALVLVSPDGFESPGFEYGRSPDVPALMGLMRYTLPAFMLRSNVEIAYADKSALGDDVFRRYRDMMRAPGNRAALVDMMGQVMLVPPEPLLAQIEAPTLLVWGERDRMIPATNAQDYLNGIDGAKLVGFPDLGHVPHEEAPARSLPPVADFLDRHLAGRGDPDSG